MSDKERVSRELGEMDIGSYGLADVDARLEEYVLEVARNPGCHNVYEQLGVLRFLRLVERYGISRRGARRFINFYEFLYFPGKRGATRYRLTPVQVFQYVSIYGFVREDGRRVTREAVLYVPRKFSKTTSSASIAIYDLLYGEANAESYTGANSADQAKKCFDAIRFSMRRLDPDERRYTINEQMIKSARRDRSAFAQCLTANARTKDGLNASTVIMDEFSQARDSDLLTVLTTSMGVRDNPLTVIITTASDVFDGPFYSMLDGYKRLLRGEYEDDSVFAHIFEPDAGDDEGDPVTWRKVHPHLGVTVSEEFYRREYESAVRNGAEAMLAFRTKLLNVYAENSRRAWISATEVRQYSIPFDVFAVKGRPRAMLGIDLSERDDFSAISVGVLVPGEFRMVYHTAYFFPQGALSGHPNEKLYRQWHSQGWLHVIPGEVIDYTCLVDYVLRLAEVLTIEGIGYDGWKSQEFYNMLANAGGRSTLRMVKQTYGEFTAPVQSFEHNLRLGNIKIDDNPINRFCFGNAVLDEDRMGNLKPQKRQGTGSRKIDGVITMLMAHKLFLVSEM